jgi:hypothetical protein
LQDTILDRVFHFCHHLLTSYGPHAAGGAAQCSQEGFQVYRRLGGALVLVWPVGQLLVDRLLSCVVPS